jgi:hypothetical protein
MRKMARLFQGLLGLLLSLGLLMVAIPPANASNDEAGALIGFYAEGDGTPGPGVVTGPQDTVLVVFNAEDCVPPVPTLGVTDNIRAIFYNDSEVRVLDRSVTLTECDVQVIDPENIGILTAPGFTGLGLVGVINVTPFGIGAPGINNDISGVQIIGFEAPDQVTGAPSNLLASNTSSGLSISNLQSDITQFDGSFPFLLNTEDGSKVTLDSPWESFGVLANPASVPATVTLNVYQRNERFLGDFHLTLTPRDLFIFTPDETLGMTLVAPFLFGATDIVAVDVQCSVTMVPFVPGCFPFPFFPSFASSGLLGWGFNVNGVSGEMMSYNMAQDTDDTVRLEDFNFLGPHFFFGTPAF